MIVRGTNLPIIITFDEDASTFQSLSVILRPRDSTTAIKTWNLSSVEVEGSEVRCPIEQGDLFAPNLSITEDLNVAIEIKWMNATDAVENAVIFYDYISFRADTTIL